MGLGQCLHQASGDGVVGGGSDAAVMAQCGAQLPATTAAASCSPALLFPKHPPGGQQEQSVSSVTELGSTAV